MKQEDWDIGYLKYYDSATLMHCRVDPVIDYLEITIHLRLQRSYFYKKMRELSNQHKVYKGIEIEPGKSRLNLGSIEGLSESGWTSYNFDKLLSKDNQDAIYKENKRLLERIKNDSELSEPFMAPVFELHPDLEENGSYLAVISDPIDLRTISQKLEKRFYITPEMLIADLHRMVENCKTWMKHVFIEEKTKGLEKNPFYHKAEEIQNKYLRDRKAELGMIIPTVSTL